jgi:hypothetical protein
MKKKELSPKELQKVLELRQLGAKWTEIEREIVVDRRAVKRAYEEWERDKIIKDQEAVRFRVAAEAFHEHLNDLIVLAESLVDALALPQTLRGLIHADDVLEQFRIRNIFSQQEENPISSDRKERMIRRKKMLFKSIQEHTREKIRWESLEEWKQARNIAVGYSKEIRFQATEVIVGILSNRLDLKERLINAIADINIPEKISDGVQETIWRGILTGEPDQMHVIEGANKWRVWLEFYEGDVDTKLDLPDLDLAKEVLSMCRETVTKLRDETKSRLVQGLADQVANMRERTAELEESLDALILRPIILRTRCDLCPA